MADGNVGSILPENSQFSKKAENCDFFFKYEILSLKIVVINSNFNPQQNTTTRPAADNTLLTTKYEEGDFQREG